jgi:hypothetical protein
MIFSALLHCRAAVRDSEGLKGLRDQDRLRVLAVSECCRAEITGKLISKIREGQSSGMNESLGSAMRPWNS